MKTCTWRSSCCQKGSRESCKALHRWKRKITLATYLSQFSTMVTHQWWGICGKFEYVLLKTYQVTGSRLLPTCLANSTGRPGSPCLFFKISETVSNFKQCQTFFMIVGKMLLPDEAEHFSLFILQLDSLLPSLKIICLSCLAFVKDFFEFLKESSPCVSRKAGWTRSIRK